MEQTEKPIYKRVVACFCAFLICCLVAFCGFAIPKVNASESVGDQFEDYIDTMYGEGAYTIINTLGSTNSWFTGFMMGLDFIQVMDSGNVPLDSMTTFTGFYVYSNVRHSCSTTRISGTYYASDDPIIIAKSDLFELRASVAPATSIGTIYWDGNYGDQNLHFVGVSGTQWNVQINEVRGAPFFSSNLENTFTNSNVWFNFKYGYNNGIPTYTDSTTLQSKIEYYNANGSNSFLAGQRSAVNLGTVANDKLGISSSTLVSGDSVIDFIVNTVNPIIIEDYPELEPFIFVPTEPATETQAGSGCNCHVDVYVEPTVIVNVEPTIIVDNNIEFPSEWYTDYTAPSIPSHETIPFPTQDSSNTEPVTMPTMDIDEYKQTYGNAIEFWFYLAAQLIEKLGLELLTGFAFVLSVVGFVLWRLGSSGGGKND